MACSRSAGRRVVWHIDRHQDPSYPGTD
jgi:hypothetical protein